MSRIKRLWRKAGIEGATLHDLRRTGAWTVARLGVNRLVVGKVLGQADMDVTGRYNSHAYDREKRLALEKWGDELQRIIGAREDRQRGNVLPWAEKSSLPPLAADERQRILAAIDFKARTPFLRELDAENIKALRRRVAGAQVPVSIIEGDCNERIADVLFVLFGVK